MYLLIVHTLPLFGYSFLIYFYYSSYFITFPFSQFHYKALGMRKKRHILCMVTHKRFTTTVLFYFIFILFFFFCLSHRRLKFTIILFPASATTKRRLRLPPPIPIYSSNVTQCPSAASDIIVSHVESNMFLLWANNVPHEPLLVVCVGLSNENNNNNNNKEVLTILLGVAEKRNNTFFVCHHYICVCVFPAPLRSPHKICRCRTAAVVQSKAGQSRAKEGRREGLLEALSGEREDRFTHLFICFLLL
eukprot:gene11814-8125_t